MALYQKRTNHEPEETHPCHRTHSSLGVNYCSHDAASDPATLPRAARASGLSVCIQGMHMETPTGAKNGRFARLRELLVYSMQSVKQAVAEAPGPALLAIAGLLLLIGSAFASRLRRKGHRSCDGQRTEPVLAGADD